ncbi:MAG: hypothetical protein ABI361_09385 [Nitrososphaera sp.]|jgi:hypothetical protein
MSQATGIKGRLAPGILAGAIAGAVATWSISFVIAMTELVLHFPIGTFYTIMGVSLGINVTTTAAYVAFGLHILTGTVLGMIVGLAVVRLKGILNTVKNVEIGIIAGVIISLVLFIPVTLLLIEPSIRHIVSLLGSSANQTALSNNINVFVSQVTASAVAFHILWGAIFGYMFSAMLRIRAYRLSHVGLNV